MVTRDSLGKSPVGNDELHYNPLSSRGLASALLPTIHRRPEMGPPIAAKNACSFNAIAYSILPSREGNHYGKRHISTWPAL
jgi:hypothetical protein